MDKPLRIAINAQIPTGGGAGGVETVLRVLLSIAQFGDGEEYTFIGHCYDADWIEPLLGDRQKLVRAPPPQGRRKPAHVERFKTSLGPMLPIARRIKGIVARPFAAPPRLTDVPVSGGFYESLGCDVIHFPYQDYVYCPGTPTVYNPHDLQHLHYPEFFTKQELKRRELIYPAGCQDANVVVVATQSVKEDVIRHYGTEGAKVDVVPWAPPELNPRKPDECEAARLLKKYACPSRPLILYPAMTWEHKNHLRLLEAVYLLRERDGISVNLVCTGHRNEFYPTIDQRLRKLNLESQIQFTGIVEYKELAAFYDLADFVVIPTLFEAASAPVFEAWQHGTPVACSSIGPMIEQVAYAAILFDPLSVERIADALKRMTCEEGLREEYRRRGYRRLRDFSLERTAMGYLAAYKKAAQRRINK